MKQPKIEAEIERRLDELMGGGRNFGPAILSGWWTSGDLDRDVLRGLIGPVWGTAEWPIASIGQRTWLKMWRSAGFVSDDGNPPPTEPMRLWRGAAPWTNGRGMSWTRDRDRARWFARRTALFCEANGLPGLGLLFEALVPPHAVLAEGVDGRGESEVVVNPSCLRGQWSPRVIEKVYCESSEGD